MRNGTAGKILEMEDIQYINLRNITKLQGNGRKQGIGHDNDKTIQNLEKGENWGDKQNM